MQRSQSIDADHRLSGDLPTADIEHKPLGASSDRFVGAELPPVAPNFLKDDFRGSELTQSTHSKHRSRRTTLSEPPSIGSEWSCYIAFEAEAFERAPLAWLIVGTPEDIGVLNGRF
ncbi:MULTISPECIES: hypothetical protein [unclassified Variovorax]|uniref:hypothetical protein n=1 Tax=unclassified Variovorax TaxID=663243 RepID=UPI00131E1B6B|nr:MULTISPECIES: hypothetical protein [unclassified Variovorax]QRY31496.1 hypothetical protein JVX96_26095 [Variovorax sp. PDNC026]